MTAVRRKRLLFSFLLSILLIKTTPFSVEPDSYRNYILYVFEIPREEERERCIFLHFLFSLDIVITRAIIWFCFYPFLYYIFLLSPFIFVQRINQGGGQADAEGQYRKNKTNFVDQLDCTVVFSYFQIISLCAINTVLFRQDLLFNLSKLCIIWTENAV